jgi:hypothetical protein
MTGAAARERGRFRSETLVVAAVALVGLWRGLWPLADNSGFTHLATGIRMVRSGILPAIPRVDPYTFTAAGHSWVVQSWLPSATVGWAHRLGGIHAVLMLSGVTFAALAWLIASLARTGRPGRTAVAAVAALLIGAPSWAPRPLLAGLLCLGLTVLIVERRRSPWLLVPLVWVWVNSHGSFPLGLLWLALVTAGAFIDRDAISLSYIGAFVAGLVAAVVNPLGVRVLTFPATALRRREVFSHIVEWQSPDFQKASGVLMLAGLVLAAVILLRGRLTWRDALPVAVFVGLGLSAARNMAPLGVIVAPALARALAGDGVAYTRDEAFRVVAGGLAVAAALVALLSTQDAALETSEYPVRSVLWLERHHRFSARHRVATTDFVGNYLELRHGAKGEVFIDDRADMFPLPVERDYRGMRDGTNRGVTAMDRWEIDTVLWRSRDAFAQRLTANGGWTVAFKQPDWVVLVRE